MAETTLTDRQREILECIDRSMQERGYPPSVREIGDSVGLASPSTVHSHLSTLQRMGFLVRNPTKPIRWRVERCECTVEGEARPTLSPISRTEGG